MLSRLAHRRPAAAEDQVQQGSVRAPRGRCPAAALPARGRDRPVRLQEGELRHRGGGRGVLPSAPARQRGPDLVPVLHARRPGQRRLRQAQQDAHPGRSRGRGQDGRDLALVRGPAAAAGQRQPGRAPQHLAARAHPGLVRRLPAVPDAVCADGPARQGADAVRRDGVPGFRHLPAVERAGPGPAPVYKGTLAYANNGHKLHPGTGGRLARSRPTPTRTCRRWGRTPRWPS